MKVRTIVDFKFDSAFKFQDSVWIGWNGVEFKDSLDNTIKLEINDDELLVLANMLAEKARKIQEERAAIEESAYESAE